MTKEKRLGVNVDHVATLRQARGVDYPSPLEAALLALEGGADGITIHLREDRRHIVDSDVEEIKNKVNAPLNLEMAVTEEMLGIALKNKPAFCCLVPENRQELTTEGGLDVIAHLEKVKAITQELRAKDINVSLFIDPDNGQIDAAKACGANVIELHTGCFADAIPEQEVENELLRIQQAAAYGCERGLIVNAGHGLHYENVQPIIEIPEIHELNIGHSIVSMAVFLGLKEAVAKMKALMV